MHKLFLVARREYSKCVQTKGFILLTLGLPLAIVALVAIAVVASNRGPVSVGYVDQADVIQNPGVVVTTPSGESVGPDRKKASFRSFADPLAGQAAVKNEEIAVLYVLPADYLTSGRVQAYYWSRPPSAAALEQFKLLLRANLVSDQGPEVQVRVLEGAKDVAVRSLDARTRAGGSGFGTVVIPGILALFFTFALMASVGYLLQAVTEEKENRTVEVMATSLSANQLIGGKTAGLIAVALTQLATWILVAVAALAVAARFSPPPGDLEVSGWFLAIAALYFIPSFVLAASLVIAIGAAVSDFQQGQQITGVLSILFLLPVFFLALVLQNPDSPVLVALTLFPTTSFATVAFRWGATVIPFWQLAVSWVCLVLTASAMVLVAPRVFRRGMLRYGRRMTWRSMLAAARSRSV